MLVKTNKTNYRYDLKTANEKIIKFNREIGLFMGDLSGKIFDDSNYWSSQTYHTSWDSLMEVIQKIKKEVYNTGYDLFGSKHAVYVQICGACYDADLKQAWEAVAYWVRLFYNKQERTDIQYLTNHQILTLETLIVSNHAIERFKERIMDMPTKTIRKILSSQELVLQYKQGGIGPYLLAAFPSARIGIKDGIVKTVLNKEEDDVDVFYKDIKIT